jgi:hypothetical protein
MIRNTVVLRLLLFGILLGHRATKSQLFLVALALTICIFLHAMHTKFSIYFLPISNIINIMIKPAFTFTYNR